MKKLMIIAVLTILTVTVAPGYAFIDYLFGGSQTRNAIDNSALGDLRAWWTGNPAYQFNPFYSGSANPAQQQAGGMNRQQSMPQSYSPGAMQQGMTQPQPQPSVTYFPPQQYQQQQQQQYGYGAPQPQQQYQGQPVYGAAGASLPYQGPPQQYQQPVQQYQQPVQQYQQPVQQYQQPAQQYQQPVQQYQQSYQQ
jgi:hypothetical protein